MVFYKTIAFFWFNNIFIKQIINTCIYAIYQQCAYAIVIGNKSKPEKNKFMNTHADETQENKSQTVTAEASQMQSGGESTFQFVDNRPEAVAQRKLQEMANNSTQVKQLRAFQDMANNSPQAKQTAQLQAMADNSSSQQQQPIQRQENKTGLPDNLKTGMENLSGMSLDDVKVHRNSDKPAQLQAHGYAQGTDIHLGPGQEKHLPHEAWHVVQQKQGRVKPTMQMKGKVNVNDDAGLEKEADVMGAKAENIKLNTSERLPLSLKKNTIRPIRQNKLEIEGINISSISYIRKLAQYEVDGKLTNEESQAIDKVLDEWITSGKHKINSWEEAIEKAKSSIQSELAPEANNDGQQSSDDDEFEDNDVERSERANEWTGSIKKSLETKIVLTIPSGFPGMDIPVEIKLEEESDGESTEWKYEAKGGITYDAVIVKLGLEIELKLAVKVPKGDVSSLDAAKMAVADFIMRQRGKDAVNLKAIADEAIPAVNGAEKTAKLLAGKAQTDLKNVRTAEQVNALKTSPKWKFWKETPMDGFLAHQKIVSKTFKGALKLLGCKEDIKLNSFSADTIRRLVQNILNTENEDGVKVMQVWAEWSNNLSKEANGLRKLFNSLDYSEIAESNVEYSIQGMINAFAQLGNLDTAGAKITVGAGVKASWDSDSSEAKLERILMVIGELSVPGVQGKLTGELSSGGNWKGELEAKIPGILPFEMNLNLLGPILRNLTAQCNSEAQKEGKQGDEGLTVKCKEFMKLAKTVSLEVAHGVQSGHMMSDLIVVFSIEEEVKDNRTSTYKVGVQLGSGKTVEAKIASQSAEQTEKTMLQVEREF